jgi:hypothetical protein
LAAERRVYAPRLAAKLARVALAQLSPPVACQACPRDGQAYCLTLEAEKIGATEERCQDDRPHHETHCPFVQLTQKGEA